jgi:hypothetical protein
MLSLFSPKILTIKKYYYTTSLEGTSDACSTCGAACDRTFSTRAATWT